jgi:hypothetical protein
LRKRVQFFKDTAYWSLDGQVGTCKMLRCLHKEYAPYYGLYRRMCQLAVRYLDATLERFHFQSISFQAFGLTYLYRYIQKRRFTYYGNLLV